MQKGSLTNSHFLLYLGNSRKENFLQLATIKCPACGAIANPLEGQTQFQCEYCKNTISIIKPISVADSFAEGLNEAERKKYENYVSILTQSMLAGNYGEAYSYCNKALEVNPKSAPIWENKAICSFWLSTVGSIADEKASEILTYLHASKQSDSNSKTYETTASSIANNLYLCTLYRYEVMQPDAVSVSPKGYTSRYWSKDGERAILNTISIFELCYQINPVVDYLKAAVTVLTTGKISWLFKDKNGKYSNTSIAVNHVFDAVQKRNVLIDKIKSVESAYVPPELYFQKPNYDALWIILALIGAIIIGSLVGSIRGVPEGVVVLAVFISFTVLFILFRRTYNR